MFRSVAESLFAESQRTRLSAIADVVDWSPIRHFDAEDAADLLARTDVLLTGWGVPLIDEAALDAAPNLKAIVHAAGTIKGFVTDACWERGVRVTSAAAANARPVAEFTLAAIIMANKAGFLAQQRYRQHRSLPPWTEPLPTLGNRGRRVGIVGASRVGRGVIELLRPFELEVVVADPLLGDEEATTLGVELLELDDLLASCDVVSLHAPLLPETVGLIDARRIALMRDGATFINTARGAIVDGDALEAELSTGRISAVIDTTDPEPLPASSLLYELANVFLTPHIAGSTGTELGRMADLAIDELERFAAGLSFQHEIKAEDVPWIA